MLEKTASTQPLRGKFRRRRVHPSCTDSQHQLLYCSPSSFLHFPVGILYKYGSEPPVASAIAELFRFPLFTISNCLHLFLNSTAFLNPSIWLNHTHYQIRLFITLVASYLFYKTKIFVTDQKRTKSLIVLKTKLNTEFFYWKYQTKNNVHKNHEAQFG